MDILFKVFLVLHIIGGATGLLTGTVNIVGKKGGKRHRLLGNIFFAGMLTAGFSALVLSVMHQNWFLFIVGVLTIYLTSTGKRYLAFKQSQKTPELIDHVLTFGMLLTAMVFMVLGIMKLVHKDNFGIVFLSFGIIGLRFARTDLSNFSGKSTIKNYWLTGHLQRMIGAYIAAITAFLVVNGKYLPSAVPGFAVWLLPTVLLVPLIVIWTRKYQRSI